MNNSELLQVIANGLQVGPDVKVAVTEGILVTEYLAFLTNSSDHVIGSMIILNQNVIVSYLGTERRLTVPLSDPNLITAIEQYIRSHRPATWW